MNFVFIDTNTWIYLAQELESVEYFNKLNEIFSYPDFKLIVPQSTQVEFERHRGSIIKTWEKKFNSQITNSSRLLKEILPDRLEEIEKIFNDARALVKKSPERIKNNLNLVDRLFAKAEIASIENYMSEATRRCLYHIAPAHKSSRSSAGDCIFWLTALAYLDKGDIWLCTADNKDFSSEKKNELDEQLQEDTKVKPFNIKYFNELASLIQAVLPYKPQLPELKPLYRSCPRCDSLNFVKMTRTIPGSWIDYLKCLDCGNEILTNIEYMVD